ncbi:glycosyltransferase family 2 protein [Anaerocolumna aminovalerica]|uniref:glycosyltransferase family 2 protein n=1 Tax=Anaerocolumna aminovalerica TaxID=1527 RepID=UPI000BE3B4AC|nr:glycosyltransferase family 2 protein [Anaerocolumna aminovalerica]
MITISACLIVKNEEKILARCLDSIKDIVDEIVIVDTGSTDKTKDIARNYTDKIYDFQWIDDFAAARNFSFSKASKDYIYVADADEVIDQENRIKFLQLKEAMLPEIEIVQMKYANQLQFNTTYNFDVEYRPKLYKRVRSFCWIDPIHESIDLEPVIFDSDIEILHLPMSNHAPRDFEIFQKIINRGEKLSKKLINMYARELFIAGTKEDFLKAESFFEMLLEDDSYSFSYEERKAIQCVLVRCSSLKNDLPKLLKYSLNNVAGDKPSSEICYELGEYFFGLSDYKEAIIWFYNAAYETECELNIHYGGDYPLKKLSACYENLGNIEQADAYNELAKQWKAE